MMSASMFLVSALVTVIALILTMLRVIPLRYMLGYAMTIDITFSVCMVYVFSGTFTGAFSATLAGLLLAIFLTLGRYVFGYSTIEFRFVHGRLTRKDRRTPPRWYCPSVKPRFWRLVSKVIQSVSPTAGKSEGCTE